MSTNLNHDMRALLAAHGIAEHFETVMNALDNAGAFDPTWSDETDDED